MANQPPLVSAYEIVLSEEHLEDLGRFTALFSQIDAMLFQIIAGISNTPTESLLSLIEGTTSGQRISMLRRTASNAKDGILKTKIKDLSPSLNAINDKRNHLMHGMWGLYWNFEHNTIKPACMYDRNKDNPIFANQLGELCKRTADITLKVADVFGIIRPEVMKPHSWL